jgi:hypothetical protein
LVDAAAQATGYNALRSQYKTYKGPFEGTEYAEEKTLASVF